MRNYILATLSLALLLFSTAAWSNMITVMKDGTGDYTLLQPAADAAAAGDTLLIGPGRYEEVTEFYFNSGVRRDAHLVVRVDNLTIMGMDRDSVILGPTVPQIAIDDPVGLVVAQNVTVTHIEKMTFENTWVGAYTLGDFYVDDCIAQDCESGITAEGPIAIEHSTIRGNRDGMRVFYAPGLVRVSYCELIGNTDAAINLTSPQRAEISNSHIMGGGGGIQFNNCPGFVESCVIEHLDGEGIVVLESGTVVTIANNTLQDNLLQMDISSYAMVDLHQNSLLDSRLYGIWIRSPSTVTAHENDFISSQGYLVYVSGHLVSGIEHYDFTNNYWGTTDADTIADRIWDNNDFSQTQAVIDVDPYAGAPVPAELTSFGKLKALFQARH